MDQPIDKIKELGNRYKQWIVVIVVIVAAILVTLLILKLVRAFKKPANATYVQGGGSIPVGWDPTQITKQIFDVIDGTLVFSSTMEDTFGKFNQLNDNQMIDVYNKWNDLGYDEEKKYYMFPLGSLTQAIKDKVGYVTAGINQKDLAVVNLERLHLT